MKYTPPKLDRINDMAAIDVSRLTEDEARAILEGIRWPEGKPVCPHCGSTEVTRIKGEAKRVRDGLLQCKKCYKQFTVTVGTIMQGSHITLRQWVQAFYAMSASKKGVSALQLQRNLGIHSYKCAWHLAHRIRQAMQKEPYMKLLKGIVEVDETYIGGKSRQGIRGRGSERKTPVLGLVERNGQAVITPIEKVDSDTLKSAIKSNVDKDSTISTDEWPSYRGIGDSFTGGHLVVHHKDGEYVHGNASTNQAESFFSLLKRGVYGIFHSISRKHLHRYCDEFSFRWDNRKTSDGERAARAIKGFVGKRLTYSALVR